MYGYIAGITDTDEINFCPYCGDQITTMHAGGTVTCDSCKRRFGVIELKEKKNVDPSQNYDERMKRFLHYMERKGMNEQWIETSQGELRIIIEALADYYDMANRYMETMEAGYSKATWEHRLGRIKQIQNKLEEKTEYNRDRQLEICMKRKSAKKDDIGEDALVLAYRKGKK